MNHKDRKEHRLPHLEKRWKDRSVPWIRYFCHRVEPWDFDAFCGCSKILSALAFFCCCCKTLFLRVFLTSFFAEARCKYWRRGLWESLRFTTILAGQIFIFVIIGGIQVKMIKYCICYCGYGVNLVITYVNNFPVGSLKGHVTMRYSLEWQ